MQTISRTRKFFSFPLIKIIIGLIVCVGAVVLAQQIFGIFRDSIALSKDYRNLLKGLFVSLVAIGSYILLFRFYEKRNITELSVKKLGQNLLIGTLLGATLQSLTILVIYLSGGFKVISINPVSYIIIPLIIGFTVAIIEEVLIRGIIFRIMEEKLGSYLAILISALIFGALHLPNPNSTLLSSLCIAIQAGLLFGAAYIYSRNLWFIIAIHFAWNFTQSGIFGAVTSGTEKTGSLLNSTITGPTLITGGEFGPEGTIQATLFCLTATVVLMILNHRQNKLILPYWKKPRVSDNSQSAVLVHANS